MNTPKQYFTRLAGLAALFACALGAHGGVVSASGSLLSRAITNTDSATYYREADTTRTSLMGLKESELTTEIYDQVHNRERDHASFVITRSGGKTQRYSVDVVMMNDRTYYRSTLNHAGWKVQSGYGYIDRTSGSRWVRSPLSFAYLARLPITAQGTAAGGTYHVRFRTVSSTAAKAAKASARADVWISTHGKPYIVHFARSATAVLKGKRASESVDTRLSGFNQPVTISAPKLSA